MTYWTKRRLRFYGRHFLAVVNNKHAVPNIIVQKTSTENIWSTQSSDQYGATCDISVFKTNAKAETIFTDHVRSTKERNVSTGVYQWADTGGGRWGGGGHPSPSPGQIDRGPIPGRYGPNLSTEKSIESKSSVILYSTFYI